MLTRTSVHAFVESAGTDRRTLAAGAELDRRSGIIADAVAVIDVLCTTFAALSIVHSGSFNSAHSTAATAVGIVALVVSMALPMRRLTRTVDEHGERAATAINSAARVVAIAALSSVLIEWHTLWLAPLVIALCADWRLSHQESPHSHPVENHRRSRAAIVLVATVAASCTISVLSATNVSNPVWTAGLMAFALLCTAAAAVVAVGALLARDRAAISDTLRSVIQLERRHRAHWLHDDVCSSLREVTLRLESLDVDTRTAGRLVAEIEHRVRLRQLDDLVDIDHARIGEVLQPFIRKAQQAGVTLTDVPAYEVSSVTLPERAARLVRAALELLTERSIRGGARELGFAVVVAERVVRVSVTDDVPGAGLSDITPDDELRLLMAALRPGGLALSTTESGGSAIVADVPLA